jgi:hypothetical protein
MEKKLPSIYSNKIDKQINNNEKVHYTTNSYKEEKIDINKKINKIFNSPNYVYKMDVIIKIDNKEKEYRVIGKNQKNLITYNNELIPIEKIEDINIKKEE